MKQEKLKEELLKLKDTGKSRIIKKFNLSPYCIKTIEDLLQGKYRDFISKEVADCLIAYEYIVIPYEIGYKLLGLEE